MNQVLLVINQYAPFLVSYAPNLVGIALPILIEILAKDIPPDQELKRFIAACTICFIAALLTSWNSIMLGNPQDVITSFGIIFTESQIVFKAYFKESWFRQRIQQTFPPIQLDPATAAG